MMDNKYKVRANEMLRVETGNGNHINEWLAMNNELKVVEMLMTNNGYNAVMCVVYVTEVDE